MLLIWGLGQCRMPASQWHDGQIAHGAHARIARRANQAATPAVLTSWQNIFARLDQTPPQCFLGLKKLKIFCV
jgi:hypothetical protein